MAARGTSATRGRARYHAIDSGHASGLVPPACRSWTSQVEGAGCAALGEDSGAAGTGLGRGLPSSGGTRAESSDTLRQEQDTPQAATTWASGICRHDTRMTKRSSVRLPARVADRDHPINQ
jgi:hypothetical protein